MRIQKIQYQLLFIMFLFLCIGILCLSADSAAGSNMLDDFSFDDCIPFEARAVIMEVHPGKGQLVVAEQTIFVVDLGFGDQRLITELADAEGHPLDLGSLRRGQWVHVKGFRHIDGGVVASQVQRIESPERKKPLLRKINKHSYRQRGIRRRSALAQE